MRRCRNVQRSQLEVYSAATADCAASHCGRSGWAVSSYLMTSSSNLITSIILGGQVLNDLFKQRNNLVMYNYRLCKSYGKLGNKLAFSPRGYKQQEAHIIITQQT